MWYKQEAASLMSRATNVTRVLDQDDGFVEGAPYIELRRNGIVLCGKKRMKSSDDMRERAVVVIKRCWIYGVVEKKLKVSMKWQVILVTEMRDRYNNNGSFFCSSDNKNYI